MVTKQKHYIIDQYQIEPFYGRYASQTVLANTCSYELDDFVEAKLNCRMLLTTVTTVSHSDYEKSRAEFCPAMLNNYPGYTTSTV